MLKFLKVHRDANTKVKPTITTGKNFTCPSCAITHTLPRLGGATPILDAPFRVDCHRCGCVFHIQVDAQIKVLQDYRLG